MTHFPPAYKLQTWDNDQSDRNGIATTIAIYQVLLTTKVSNIYVNEYNTQLTPRK